MHHTTRLTLVLLALILATTGCATTDQRPSSRSRAHDRPEIVTHADRESNFNN